MIIKYFILIFCFNIPLFCFAKNKDSLKIKQIPKHSIGIQINPYLRGMYIRRNEYPIVFALRYGYNITDNIRTGIDFSERRTRISYEKSELYNIGLFARYSFVKISNIKFFFEANLFYSKYHGITYYNNISEILTLTKIDYFIAPGATFYFLKKHLSLDLLFKYNHKFHRGLSLGPVEFSYRVNYHFNQIKFK